MSSVEYVVGRPRCGLSSTSMGRASELEAASKLIRAGHRVAVPLADDDGVDLVVNYRHTVQVKASGNLSEPIVNGKSYVGNYLFSIKRKLNADFLICHAVPDDFWWVIPSSEVDSLSLALTPVPRHQNTVAGRLLVYLDAWDLFGGRK